MNGAVVKCQLDKEQEPKPPVQLDNGAEDMYWIKSNNPTTSVRLNN